MNEPYYNEYLGDGVYALFDGYHIWLTVTVVIWHVWLAPTCQFTTNLNSQMCYITC